MTTTVAKETLVPEKQSDRSGSIRRLVRSSFVRELLIILAFMLMTSAMTWPYLSRMRNAVAGPGDPYLVAWMMWWDYHQTFTDPLNLFNSNTFYPYKYSLAFSETCYGIALPFFPLYALGFTPLTVHAFAMFMGFALSGYAAFRLMRTLTGSTSAAWVAGIIFAFIPYRFNLMAQLMYLWSVWLPLLFEALVLFVGSRSWKRAIWLGVAFFMTGLTTVTWLLLSLIPLSLAAAILLTRHRLWRERQFWTRSLVSLCVAAAALLPFTIPFYLVRKIYGFERTIDDVRSHSASPMHWLVAEGRSKLWKNMGNKIPEAWKFQMFPGLLVLLLPLGELILGSTAATTLTPDIGNARLRWARVLDLLALILFALFIPALGFAYSDQPGRLFAGFLTTDYLPAILGVVLITRMCLAYPKFLRRNNANLIQTVSNMRTDAFWIAVMLVVVGFLCSIGWNTFIYRLLYYHMPGFKSIRAPMRGAMFAYLGLSLLSGLGVKRLAGLVTTHRLRVPAVAIYLVVCGLLLLELNNAPLYFIRGDAYPDGVTKRLKELNMRGGITYFPAGIDFNQRYMLRAADHQKPLILGTSGFTLPYVSEIERMTAAGPIPKELMDLFEQIPASYLVVEHKLIPEPRTKDFKQFLVREVSSGRLRYINSYDDHSDLYAIVKTEPEAKSEAPLPSSLAVQDWPTMIHDDPGAFLYDNLSFGQRLYRVFVATHGVIPRYKEFMAELEKMGQGVIVGSDEQEKRISDNFQKFIDESTKSDRSLAQLNDAQYVSRVLENAAVGPESTRALIDGLTSGKETRASVLLKVVDDPRFIEKQNYPSLVELHYFVYLRRNPDDPPDGNLNGFNFWIQDLERNHDPSKISKAFKIAGEYVDAKKS